MDGEGRELCRHLKEQLDMLVKELSNPTNFERIEARATDARNAIAMMAAMEMTTDDARRGVCTSFPLFILSLFTRSLL